MMAQKEMMLRLIKDGEIVGYQLHTFTNSEGIHHSRTPEIINYTEEEGGGSDLKLGNNILHMDGNSSDGFWFDNWIDHDSFEFGIKVNAKWQFGGDRVHNKEYGNGTLVYSNGTFSIEWDNESENLDYGAYCNIYNTDNKYIGNIHKLTKKEK